MAGNDNPIGIVVRGKRVAEDELGRIRLDDIWNLAGAKPNKHHRFWRRGRAAKALEAELDRYVRNSHNPAIARIFPVVSAKQGVGTYAHPIMAAGYAGYLDAKLEIEIREVWLRYRAGDAALADEILERASAEENRRIGVRALARAQRKSYTQTLKDHGVAGSGYMGCTEAVYAALLGAKSYQLRAQLGLPARANLRDNLNATALASVMLAEALSAERIAEEDRQGNTECAHASWVSASVVRSAVDQDRKSRKNAA